MKVKTPTNSNNRNKDNIIIISDEQIRGKNDDKVFLCERCNCTLSRLIDHSGENPSLYCSRCQMSFDPEYDNLRHESKITIPHEDKEPAITSIDIKPDVSIRHTPPIRGGLAELQKRGIKITSYKTTEKE